MMTKFQSIINKLKKKHPNWEQNIKFPINENSIKDDKELTNDFLDTLEQICKVIKENKLDFEIIGEVASLFDEKVRNDVEKLIRARLRPYFGCALVRHNEQNGKAALENLINEIWAQQIIRRTPGLKIDMSKYQELQVEDGELDEFTKTLSAITYHCVSRLLSYDGMVRTIQRELEIPQELCESIARKIDKDNAELRMNYTIMQLTILSD